MWIIMGLLSAFADASRNALAKHNAKSFNTIVITWSWVSFSLILIVPLMFIKGIPDLDSTFWIAFSFRIVLDFVALLLYVEAIKRTDLSLALPMLALTPLFLLASGFVINGEFPSRMGLVGVAMIIVGTYLLNFKGQGSSLFKPFRAILEDKGVLLMLVVSVMWSLTNSLHRLAISHSNPYFYAGLGGLTISLLLTPLAYWADKKQFQSITETDNLKQLVPIGLLEGVTILSQMIGQSLSLSVLVISLKRTSIVFSSVLGWYFFKEKIKSRIVPIMVMVVGVILIALS